ncbi:twin-arginine translocation pathway signal [gamma proteobacterium HTCC5015]|nr:twin-arginine translocation pathway signal [gamma proteobacterium HTCC5015]
MQRRDFIKLGLASGIALSLPACWQESHAAAFISAADDQRGGHHLVGLDRHGEIAFDLQTAQRGHGSAVNPHHPQVVYFARRPGTELTSVNWRNGQVTRQQTAHAKRHFVGHGDFSADGRYLYTPENDVEHGRGVISVRDAQTLQVLEEYPSHGVGPHEVHTLPNSQTLIVANGGILTEGRKKLNIDTMQPTLSYVDLDSGQLLHEHRLDDPQKSLRHFDVNPQGEVAIGAQIQNDNRQTGLIYTQLGEEKLNAVSGIAWPQLDGYIGSVTWAGDASLFAATTPRGHCVTLWDSRNRQLIKRLPIRDVCGLGWDAVQSRFVLTSGTGNIYQISVPDLKARVIAQHPGYRWDNHLVPTYPSNL